MAKPVKRVTVELSEPEIDALYSALSGTAEDYAASGDDLEKHHKGLNVYDLEQRLLKARADVRWKMDK